MGKRQREWAIKKRQELVDLLGGVCANCGSTEDLEIDHINGRDYKLEEVAFDQRTTRYWREYREGVPLRVLCSDCNKKLRPKKVDKVLDELLEPVF